MSSGLVKAADLMNKAAYYFILYNDVLQTDYGYGMESEWKPSNYAGNITVNKCVRKHRSTLCSLYLIIQ